MQVLNLSIANAKSNLKRSSQGKAILDSVHWDDMLAAMKNEVISTTTLISISATSRPLRLTRVADGTLSQDVWSQFNSADFVFRFLS